MAGKSFVTDDKAAAVLTALGLPPKLAEAQGVIADAETLYTYIEANPFAVETQVSTWALNTWGDGVPDGAVIAAVEARLTAALTLLEKVGRVVAFPTDWTPPGMGPVGS